MIARIRRKKDADSIWVILRSPETGKWYLILEEIMRTTKIQIRDILGIREFNMNGESIELSGSNGVGKSSVLDAIRYALTNKSGRDVIVRRGAVEGEILIETDSGLSIDRKSRINRADYKSIKQNGSEIGSPEAFLKEIFTPLQLNPIEFMAMDKKQQNAIILDMIQYDWDMSTIKQWFGEIPAWVNYDQNILAVLNDIQSENGEYYQNRRNIDRDRRNKIAFIEDIGRTLPEGYDAEKWRNASAGDIYRQIESIQRDNQLVERAKQVIENKNNKIRKFEADREIEKAAIEREFSSRDKQITEDITRLEGQIVSLRQEQSSLASKKADKLAIADKTYEASVAEYNAQCAEYNEYADRDIRDTSELSKQAQAIEDMNRNRLIDAGLIEFQRGKKGSPNKYKICTFKSVGQSVGETVVQTEVQSVGQSVGETVAIYKHKHKQNNIAPARAKKFANYEQRPPKDPEFYNALLENNRE